MNDGYEQFLNKRVKIFIDAAGKSYTYNGKITSNTTNLIEILDEREGLISLEKSKIISIKNIGEHHE